MAHVQYVVMNILRHCRCLWQALEKAKGVVEMKRQRGEALLLGGLWGTVAVRGWGPGLLLLLLGPGDLNGKLISLCWVSGLFPLWFHVGS